MCDGYDSLLHHTQVWSLRRLLRAEHLEEILVLSLPRDLVRLGLVTLGEPTTDVQPERFISIFGQTRRGQDEIERRNENSPSVLADFEVPAFTARLVAMGLQELKQSRCIFLRDGGVLLLLLNIRHVTDLHHARLTIRQELIGEVQSLLTMNSFRFHDWYQDSQGKIALGHDLFDRHDWLVHSMTPLKKCLERPLCFIIQLA